MQNSESKPVAYILSNNFSLGLYSEGLFLDRI